MAFDRETVQNVETSELTRPIKIAYIVPASTSKYNHWILDAIFHDSYTRWGGARTLIIPSTRGSFIDERYEHWLEFFDPDFVYTYVDISKKLIDKIDQLCLPIVLKKDTQKRSEATHWRDFIPDLNLYFEAVSSLTTIHSPRTKYFGENTSQLPQLLTQYDMDGERFISDNFGTSHHNTSYTNPIKGLFETYCFTHPEVVNNRKMNMGTYKGASISDVLSLLAQKKLQTFERLATLHSEGTPKIEPYKWSNTFHLFIGSTCLDRINFWNARHFVPNWTGVCGSLIIRKALLKNRGFVEALGKYFNNNNYTSSSGGHHSVTIRSLSLQKEDLDECATIIRKETYNSVFVREASFSSYALPEKREIENNYTGGGLYKKFKINEITSKIDAQEPEHFLYTPPKYIGQNTGNWAIDLKIDRHNNLSRYSNVVDTWLLPKRHNAARPFTSKLSKVNKHHLLTIIPNSETHRFRNDSTKQHLSYDLTLPSDIGFFRRLISQPPQFNIDDLRCSKADNSYVDINVSDKGQNLRGVISMFPNLSIAYEILTNHLWRNIICMASENKPLRVERLLGHVENSTKYKDRLKKELRLNKKNVVKYLEANFTDTLEYLVNRNIFYQVHSWRCEYCGHINTLSIDEVKKRNECSICDREYLFPIDAKCKFHLNDFVYTALYKHSGLTVLWGIGTLHSHGFENSFYYMPEVDLYLDCDDPNKKEEIDILCVKSGKLFAGEVKKSVLGFTRNKGRASSKEINKFIGKINRIKPDVAILIFGGFGIDGKETIVVKSELDAAIKKIEKASMVPNLKVEVIIASENRDFNEPPIDLGIWGERTKRILR